MSPSGYIEGQSGLIGAKSACSGTIATDWHVCKKARGLFVVLSGPNARTALGSTPPCTQPKSQVTLARGGDREIVPREYLMSIEIHLVSQKCD
jgi:hypothetical protein